MARVSVMPSFCTEFFAAGEDMTVPAGNLFQLVDALEALAPGFGQVAGIKVAFAVDGELAHDWTAPLADTCEVLLVPRVGGG